MRSTFREFYAPAPLFAVAVLALNDHWAKEEFANSLTGKLSDVAGCFFLPLFLSAMLEWTTPFGAATRLIAGCVATTVLFGSIKVSQPAADAVCAVLGTATGIVGRGCGGILADPTDLAALPFVGLAFWYGRRRLVHAGGGAPAYGAAQ